MNLILMPGNSIRNKEWIENIEKTLKKLFDKILIQYYNHWKTGEKYVDENYEIKVLEEKTMGLSDYVVFAKSIGTYIALKAMSEMKIHPNRCIFLGFPYNLFTKENEVEEIESLLRAINVPILFIQNSEDPACSYDKLSGILKKSKIKNYQTFEFEADTHDYKDYEKIKELVKNFVKEY